jgi:hypothetical protein
LISQRFIRCLAYLWLLSRQALLVVWDGGLPLRTAHARFQHRRLHASGFRSSAAWRSRLVLAGACVIITLRPTAATPHCGRRSHVSSSAG